MAAECVESAGVLRGTRDCAEGFRQLASEVRKPSRSHRIRKLLYRRRGLSHTLSHSVSHGLSHMTYGCADPIVPPTREGHRRKFSEADKRRIVEEAVQPGASLSEVARRYGIKLDNRMNNVLSISFL